MKKLAALALVCGALLLVLALGTVDTGSVLAQDGPDVRVIVWESTPSNDGTLYFHTPGSADEVLVDFPDGAFGNVAKLCGQDYWTKDGKGVAVFSGANEGNIIIYSLEGGAPVVLGPSTRIACSGPATFQFSPNHERVGYLSYATEIVNINDQEYPEGDLILLDPETGEQQGSFEHTMAFQLYDNGALMLRPYPDGEGYATEADLEWWDGSKRELLITLEPFYPADKEDVDCGLKTASLARVDDDAYVLLGQRCVQTNATTWRLLIIPMDGDEPRELATGVPNGGFFNDSFSANLIPTRDKSGFLMTLPSGLTYNTVALYWVTKDGIVTPALEGRHVLTERFGEKLSEGRLLLTSPDGKSLAFVSVDGNGDQTLWMLDLSTVGGTPVMLAESGTGQRVFQHVWSGNNKLFYAAGSIESDSLYVVSPGEEPQRLLRGRFFRLAVSYNGEWLAAAQWFENPKSFGDDLFRLDVVDKNGNATLLKEGDVIYNQMIPLAIR